MFIILILQAIVKMSDPYQKYAKVADMYHTVIMSKDASEDAKVAAMRDFNELKSGPNDPYFHPRGLYEYKLKNDHKASNAAKN